MIRSELIKLNAIPNVVAVRGKRILPNAVTLSIKDESRIGLCWYNPKTTEFKYSAKAKTHFRFEEFGKDFKPQGWVRGAVIKAETGSCLLVFKCDFEEEKILGPTLLIIHDYVRKHFRKKLIGMVDEEGHDLFRVTY